MRLLILGGTAEASALAGRIAGRPDIDATLSFAGRTQNPVPPPIPFRIGGFGGVAGLKAYLADNRIEAVVDATHPFAAQISANAAGACDALGIPLAVLTRPAWSEQPGDRWTDVADMDGAVRALGDTPRRVFLTVGRLQQAAFTRAPQHYYLVRSIEQPAEILALRHHRLILARGPFSIEDEIRLMRDERIDVLVTKNSGGAATEAKLAAARTLGVEVVIVERPAPETTPSFDTVDAVLAWLDGQRRAP